MKRTFAVTILVDVHADTPEELCAAKRDLLRDGPYLDRVSVGRYGSFTIKTRPRIQRMTIYRPRPSK